MPVPQHAVNSVFPVLPSVLQVLVDLVTALQWTYVAGIYTKDNYGTEGFQVSFCCYCGCVHRVDVCVCVCVLSLGCGSNPCFVCVNDYSVVNSS